MKVSSNLVPQETIATDFSVQIRADQNDPDTSYDVNGMATILTNDGYLKKPLAVEKLKSGKLRVLQGFTRLLAIRKMQNDPDVSDDIKKRFAKVQCQVYEDLTNQERDSIVYDDQDQKKLTKVEVIRWLWKLAATMEYSDIVWQHFRQLVSLSGQAERFDRQFKELPNDKERRKYVNTFFRGVIGDEILKAYALGPVVQKAFIDTAAGRLEDKEETVNGKKVVVKGALFRANRDALKRLYQARTRDLATTAKEQAALEEPLYDAKLDGKGWNDKDGGIRFNAELAKIIEEQGKTGSGPKVLSAKSLKERATQSKSRAVKIAYKIAGGQELEPDERNFAEFDMNAEACETIQAHVASKLDDIKAKMPKPYQDLMYALAYTKGSSAGFEQALLAILDPKAAKAAAKAAEKSADEDEPESK